MHPLASPEPFPSHRGLRVLVADDEPLNLRIAARLLRELGHGGVLVRDGAQALAALRSQTFDVVLLDLDMPVLDGYGVLGALRAPGASAAPPVIIVSGETGEATRTHCLAAGAVGYLLKPLTATDLQATLSRLPPG